MVERAELIEGKDMHPPLSCAGSLQYSLQVKLCKTLPQSVFQDSDWDVCCSKGGLRGRFLEEVG